MTGMISEIIAMIDDENLRRSRRFIHGSVSEFVNKFSANADVYCHYKNGVCDGVIAFYCNDPSRELAYVTLMLCAPQSRGNKIGSGLLKAAISTSINRGFKKMELEVDDDNIPAIALYKKHDFVEKYHVDGRYKMTLFLKSQ
jgi:ribosomal-protein-alanine N-acetyltransferase